MLGYILSFINIYIKRPLPPPPLPTQAHIYIYICTYIYIYIVEPPPQYINIYCLPHNIYIYCGVYMWVIC